MHPKAQGAHFRSSAGNEVGRGTEDPRQVTVERGADGGVVGFSASLGLFGEPPSWTTPTCDPVPTPIGAAFRISVSKIGSSNLAALRMPIN